MHFKALNTDGVAVFDSILSAAGKFGDGLVNILTNLVHCLHMLQKVWTHWPKNFKYGQLRYLLLRVLKLY